MGKRETGYARVERDNYPTPPWVVTDALAEHIPLRGLVIWEFACGTEGRMPEALKTAGCACVYSTDIVNGYVGQNGVLDFLSGRAPHNLPRCDGMVTNPPFGPRGKTAEAFIERSLQLLEQGFTNFVALLLPHDFDSAKTRAHLFGDCPYFAGKITLRRRIKWFEHPDPIRRRRNPKENTDWYLWRQPYSGPPIILYAPGNHNEELPMMSHSNRPYSDCPGCSSRLRKVTKFPQIFICGNWDAVYLVSCFNFNRETFQSIFSQQCLERRSQHPHAIDSRQRAQAHGKDRG